MKNLVFVGSLFLFVSGAKDISNIQVQNNSPQSSANKRVEQVFADYYNHQFKHNIIISGYAHRLMPPKGKARIDATFLNENGDLIEGVLTFNGIEYSTDTTHKNIYVSRNPGVECFEQNNIVLFTNLAGEVLVDTEIHLPKEIFITSTDQSISSGMTITYNVDETNTNGVAFLVSFQPNETENAAFSSLQAKFNVVHDDTDDGLFTVPNELLKGIPTGASVSVEVFRGNLNYNVNNPNSFGVLGYCSSETYMRVK